MDRDFDEPRIVTETGLAARVARVALALGLGPEVR